MENIVGEGLELEELDWGIEVVGRLVQDRIAAGACWEGVDEVGKMGGLLLAVDKMYSIVNS